MKCILYARVSTDRQAGRALSIPAQIEAMRRYAESNGHEVVREVIDAGASGRTMARPGLTELLSACRDGKAECVVVHKTDRLARNLADHIAIRSVLSRAGVRLISLSESLDDSVSGRLVEHIMASSAEFYSANLGEEVRKGMRQKVVRGGWPHRPPFGYRFRSTRAGNIATPYEREAKVVRRAFLDCGRGCTGLRRLLARLRRPFPPGPLPTLSALERMLRKPFYAGWVNWHGERHRGAHRPIVSQALFGRMQQVLSAAPRADRSRKHGFWLRGILSCASCGSLMTAEAHGRFRYYRCRAQVRSARSCRSRYVREQVADDAVLRVCEALGRERGVALRKLRDPKGGPGRQVYLATLFSRVAVDQAGHVRYSLIPANPARCRDGRHVRIASKGSTLPGS